MTHGHDMAGGKLRVALVLTVIILAVEIGGGLLAHSLALLSDAGHVLTDIAALGIAWFATVQASRPADSSRTFGYHRTGILAAMVNAVTLILIVAFIAFEAVQRLQHPVAVTPGPLFIAAAVGVIVNLYIGFSLRSEGEHDLNVRAAMFHVFGDVAASIAVIVGGAVILITHWYAADPIISLLIALLIARGAWDILRETVDILMESVPKGLNVAQMVRDIVREPGVQDVHDLHIWTLAGGMTCLSAHVQVNDAPLSDCDPIVQRLERMLQARYRIGHSTIQLECAGCASPHLYCAMEAGDHSHSPGHLRDRVVGHAEG